MAEQLQPESISQVLADFDRRLRNLEATQRVSLSPQFDTTIFIDTVSTYGSWVPLTGASIVIAPRSSSLVVLMSTITTDFANGGGFRCNRVRLGVEVVGFGVLQLEDLLGVGTTSNTVRTSSFGEVTGLTPGVPVTVRPAAFLTDAFGVGTNPSIGQQRLLAIPT